MAQISRLPTSQRKDKRNYSTKKEKTTGAYTQFPQHLYGQYIINHLINYHLFVLGSCEYKVRKLRVATHTAIMYIIDNNKNYIQHWKLLNTLQCPKWGKTLKK